MGVRILCSVSANRVGLGLMVQTYRPRPTVTGKIFRPYWIFNILNRENRKELSGSNEISRGAYRFFLTSQFGQGHFLKSKTLRVTFFDPHLRCTNSIQLADNRE